MFQWESQLSEQKLTNFAGDYMSSQPQQKERFHFLDGLRGIAASMIVVHHAFTSNIAIFLESHHLATLAFVYKNFTQSGVELFFVLSGVVLLRPYLRKERKFEVGTYLYRRARRIYPPFWGALVFGSIVVALNTFYPTWYSHILVRFRWSTTLSQIAIFQPLAYYNLAWWSLQLELLFYLFVPIVIFSAHKPERWNATKLFIFIPISILVVVGLQLLFTSYFPRQYTIHHVVPNIYKFIDYPVCFIMGIYLACRNENNKTAISLMLFGAGILVIAFWYPPLVSSAYGLIYGGFIMMAFNTVSIKKVLSQPLMIWLGERSYSLFLIHFSVFYFTNYLVSYVTPERNSTYALLTRLIGIPLALFLSMLLFHFVERRQARGLLTEKAFWPWQAKSVMAEQGF